MSELSDEALFAAYIRGDPGAFEELFRRYAPVLIRLFRRDIYRSQDAEELVQETFLRAHRHFECPWHRVARFIDLDLEGLEEFAHRGLDATQ